MNAAVEDASDEWNRYQARKDEFPRVFWDPTEPGQVYVCVYNLSAMRDGARIEYRQAIPALEDLLAAQPNSTGEGDNQNRIASAANASAGNRYVFVRTCRSMCVCPHEHA